MRGQAFIVFKDVSTSTVALRKLNGVDFNGKPMVRFILFYAANMHLLPVQKITYAKAKSDAIAKLDGTFNEQKRRREEDKKRQDAEPKKQKKDTKAQPKKQLAMVTDPNKILFIENLPDKVYDHPEMLEIVFAKYVRFTRLFLLCLTANHFFFLCFYNKSLEGFKEVRVVPGKKGIAFVEYENELQATNAMTRLQGWKLDKVQPMKISYSKK